MVRRARPSRPGQDIGEATGRAEGLVEPALHFPTRHRRPLAPRQLRAVDLLLCGVSVQEVADEVRVTRQRIWEWKHLPAFQAEVARRREELWMEMTQPLIQASAEAIATLRESMTPIDACGGWRPMPERVRAARVLLGIAARGKDIRAMLARHD